MGLLERLIVECCLVIVESAVDSEWCSCLSSCFIYRFWKFCIFYLWYHCWNFMEFTCTFITWGHGIHGMPHGALTAVISYTVSLWTVVHWLPHHYRQQFSPCHSEFGGWSFEVERRRCSTQWSSCTMQWNNHQKLSSLARKTAHMLNTKWKNLGWSAVLPVVLRYSLSKNCIVGWLRMYC